MTRPQTLQLAIIWLAATAAVTLALSIPTNLTSDFGAWATFYDDDNCSVNPGRAVSMNNPGCLNEPGRGSFYMRDQHRKYLLISSPSEGCHCQSHCKMLLWFHDTPCIKLGDDMRGSSYRFLGDRKGWCPKNQCWMCKITSGLIRAILSGCWGFEMAMLTSLFVDGSYGW